MTLVEAGEVVGDLEQTFSLVTNSFLLTGGDGCQAFAAAYQARGAEEPGVGERQILRDWNDTGRNYVPGTGAAGTN